jgi:hypothetical protein
LDLDGVLQDFGGNQGSFPCSYLGLPLGVKKPKKVEVQPLLDRAQSRLKGGKGKMMSFKGRLILINSVITATATYFLTAFPPTPWLSKQFDKLRRKFLWAPEDEIVSGGKCIVNWKRICAPKMYGGLGIKDMQAYSRALRLRWEWFRWKDHSRPWAGSETPCDQIDKDLFAACTKITLGNGETAIFWTDKWLDGQAPCMLAPMCFTLAARKKLTVKQAIANGRWMRGLQNMTSNDQLRQFVGLWTMVQQVMLQEEVSDTITWTLTEDGKYSARSAYDAQFFGRIHLPHLQYVWKIRAEGKVQTFLWLLLQNRKWTAERLRARGLPHDDLCCLCDQEFETTKHLAFHCPFAKEVWTLFQDSNQDAVRAAATSSTISGWWNKVRRGKTSNRKKTLISVSVYIIWHIWKERGRRIFQSKALTASALAGLIRADLQLLALANGNAIDP